MTAFRHVRDDLLATTPAGREWIALFERVQTPLIGVVLHDARLAGLAAELLASAGAQVVDERAVPSGAVARQARELVEALSERGP